MAENEAPIKKDLRFVAGYRDWPCDHFMAVVHIHENGSETATQELVADTHFETAIEAQEAAQEQCYEMVRQILEQVPSAVISKVESFDSDGNLIEDLGKKMAFEAVDANATIH